MLRGSAWEYTLPLARFVAGFIAALLLAFIGDLAGRIFNLLIGFPWALEVHRHINFVGIGIGAGLGAYLAWINLTHPRRLKLGIVLLIICAGILGVYVGRILSPGVDPSYWLSRFATDTRVYLSSALAAIVIATVVGLIDLVLSIRRLRSLERNTRTPVGLN